MNTTLAPTTSAATSGTPASAGSGVGAPAGGPVSPFNALAAMLAEEPQPGVTAPHEAPPASGTDAPPEPVAGAADADGQPPLPPETPPADELKPPGEGEPPNLPSDPDKETPKPEITKATQKRIDDLTAEKYRLRDENEALKSKLTEAEKSAGAEIRGPSPQPLPENVSKLRTVIEVEARQGQLETLVDALQDFLDANPGDAETVYDAQTQQPVSMEADGRRYLSRSQIITERGHARAELKALPKRALQITQTEQLRTAQAQLQTSLAEKFPHLKNPDHAETQMFQAAMHMPEIANHPAGPMIAYKLARGHAIVEAELAKANGNGKPLFGTPPRTVAPAPGKVPVRQPSPSGGGAAPTPAAGRAKMDDALTRNRKEGSPASLAALIAVTGR